MFSQLQDIMNQRPSQGSFFPCPALRPAMDLPCRALIMTHKKSIIDNLKILVDKSCVLTWASI